MTTNTHERAAANPDSHESHEWTGIFWSHPHITLLNIYLKTAGCKPTAISQYPGLQMLGSDTVQY